MSYYKRTKSYKRNKYRPQEIIEEKPVISKIDRLLIDANKKLQSKVSKNEAQGVALHSLVSGRTSSTYLGEIKDYSDANLEDRTTVVKLARKLRNNEGVCSSVADLLIDFAVTKGGFYSDNGELQVVLNTWSDFVNSNDTLIKVKGTIFPIPGIRALSRKIFDDYLTDGDSVFSIYWKNGVKMGQEKAAKPYMLPVTIKTLDTTSLLIDKDLASFGIEQITLKLSDKLIEKIKNPKTDADKFLKKSIPKEWVSFINKNESIILDSNVTYHLKRNAKDYEAWGKSLFQKAFTSIANKRRLQAVDESTIDGLINRFTIFKLGLPDAEKNPAYHIPKQARVDALIDILTNPTRVNAAVWPGPDLDVIDIGPDGKVLEFVDKYMQCDKDILRALHVSPVLIDGTSSNATRDWAAFVSTEVGLDAFRDELEKVFTAVGKEIAFVNKMDYTKLYYKFDTQLLKDEQRVRNFALKVFELGGISIETFVKTMGYDFETEKFLKEKEDAEGLPQLFKNEMVPYQGEPKNIPDGRPPGTKDKDLNKDKENKEVKASRESDVELYKSLYESSFRKIIKEIDNKRKYSKDDSKFLELSLISGFYLFRNMVASQLRNTFYKFSGRSISTEELSYILAWNDNYINNFYTELRDSLILKNTFDETVSSQTERLNLYATESYQKAMLAGQIVKAGRDGYTRGKWITVIDDVTCDECLNRNGNIYNLNNILSSIPVHPRCRCDIEFVK